jgi:hypothetical protein
MTHYLSNTDKVDIFPTIDKYKMINQDLRHSFDDFTLKSSIEIRTSTEIISDTTIVLISTSVDTRRLKRKQPIVFLDVYITNCTDSTIIFLKENDFSFSSFYPVIYNTCENAGEKTYKHLRKKEKEHYDQMYEMLDSKSAEEMRWNNFDKNLHVLSPNETIKLNIELDFRFPNGTSMLLELTKNEYYFAIFYSCNVGLIRKAAEMENIDINLENLYRGRTCSNLMKLIVED